MDKLISSLLAFLISLFPTTSSNIPAVIENTTTILFAGDVMLGRSVMGETIDQKDNFYPFKNTADFLKDADITYVNLENAIINDCPRQGKGSFTFCTTPEIAKGLVESGVDIVSLANNHSGNYGEDGLQETRQHLNNLGIKWIDGSNLQIIDKNGVKYGFLGFDYVYKTLKQSDLDLIKESNPLVDVLIVTPHWGEEYKAIANSFQTSTAHKMIDSGADIIVGHHPHWVQNFEEYNGKPIYYSLGNFIFDQMWSEETKKGKLVKITFKEKTLTNKEEFNSYIENVGQPKILP